MINNRNDLGEITVLVVDDTAVNRKVVTYALSDCKVLEAANSIEALEQLQLHESVDVILLDIMMPGISGYELCQKIKAQPRWRLIPVIMLTALNSVESRVNALQAGADDFISRPCDVLELQARVYNSARVKRYNEQLEDTRNILFTLASVVESRDPYTNGHLMRMEHLAEKFCLRLNLTKPELEVIRQGGLLHDIGKIGIRDEILLKPGRLTPDEYENMKQHAMIGFNIVKSLRLGKQVGPIIRSHHERWNGEGYPDGLKGKEIPFGARILGICDVFDALTSERPYRNKWSKPEALDYIRDQSGLHFDPELVPIFLQMIQDYN